MNVRSQMQGCKNWILPKEIKANRFFWDSHWLEIWKNLLYVPLLYVTEWRERGNGLWTRGGSSNRTTGIGIYIMFTTLRK